MIALDWELWMSSTSHHEMNVFAFFMHEHRDAASIIRAGWVGYRTRCRLRILRQDEVLKRQQAYYHQMATLIQKWYGDVTVMTRT